MTAWMDEKNEKTRGLIIGKFYPFHTWHKYLIDFAKNYVDELFVLVCSIKSEQIPGEIRYEWVKDSCPWVHVLHHTAENPQYPEEHPDFWQIWHDSITALVPGKIDYLFASESYGFELARVVDAEYIPVNHARDIVAISGTKIRENPIENWKYLPEKVRPYFTKKICIYWGESTWKSTLTKALAKHFQTAFINEYARDYLELKPNQECIFEDIEKIARWHLASEKAIISQGNKCIFIDTDIITTHIRSEILFWKTPHFVKNLMEEKDYDLYLLLDFDVPYVHDPLRYVPNERKELFERFKNELDKRNKKYAIISWNREKRLQSSIHEVNKILS